MNKVIAHFRKSDPILFQLTHQFPIEPLLSGSDYFASLAELIVSQQLSDKAAQTIFHNIIKLCGGKTITPQAIITQPDNALRKAGASRSKVQYLKGLSQNVLNGSLDLSSLKDRSNEEIIDKLTRYRGIGRWTAEMFLMFTLGREDVFSHGDLGLKKAICKLYRKKNDPSDMWIERVSRKWSPYRSYACLLLWKSLDQPESEVVDV